MVEVASTSRPIVVRIMDYGKHRFEANKKAREARKKESRITIKQVKLRPNIDPHDLETKLNHARRFLGEGDKVKVVIMFRGRDMRRPENGRKLLQRVIEILKDDAVIESSPGGHRQPRHEHGARSRQEMTSSTDGVVGIGNAIVDVLAHTDDEFLERFDLTKGSMTLIDAEQATKLHAKMNQTVECSGGSVANSMVGLASLGGRAGYVGKVRDDVLGEVFRRDIREASVSFDTPLATSGPPTGRCLILVTPGCPAHDADVARRQRHAGARGRG